MKTSVGELMTQEMDRKKDMMDWLKRVESIRSLLFKLTNPTDKKRLKTEVKINITEELTRQINTLSTKIEREVNRV